MELGFRKEVVERALLLAAKQVINSEGTAGEAIKRLKQIRKWCLAAEKELKASQ